MKLEIERRFLVKGEEWQKLYTEAHELQQGYLSTNFEEWIVRVRIIDKNKSKITLKALAGIMSNYEFEYSIPLKDAESMLSLISKKLHKKRYFLTLGSKEWVIDSFLGSNYPLVIAEVELDSEKELVQKPNWCGNEVTGVKKFSNAALAQCPICDWPEEELQSFNLS